MEKNIEHQFVAWFRNSSPYIHAFRGRTFVISFDGEAVAAASFPGLIHDIALLNNLGVRLVLVHGARPQIEERLRGRGTEIRYVNGLRITDEAALACVKDAVGTVRTEIEALLSMGLANSPMAGVRIRVAGGNFVTAKPVGVREGVDYHYTGELRRIDSEAIQQRLDEGAIVLISPLGYSPTGEVFNLTALEVATGTAVALKADKLISLVDGRGLTDAQQKLVRQLSLKEAQRLMSERPPIHEELSAPLHSAIRACHHGVRRAHLIDRHIDGALLLELFTRDGIGTMITTDIYEGLRQAAIDDVGGILELIAPLEAEGILVRRSRERLEMEIDHFNIVERDGAIIACAALYPYPQEKVAEMACLAVHDDYRQMGYGHMLLKHVETKAKQLGIERLFVLSTQTAHWFLERGFASAELSDLPLSRQQLYNYQRQSKVFIKKIS